MSIPGKTTARGNRAGTPSGDDQASGEGNALTYVRLVMVREFSTRVRTKPFLITNIIMIVAVVGAIIAASIIMSGLSGRDSVGVVGSASSLSARLTAVGDEQSHAVEAKQIDSAAAARDQVTAGDLDAALVPDGAQYSVIVKTKLSPELRSVIDTAVSGQASTEALRSLGVDPSKVAAAVAKSRVNVDAVDPPKPHAVQRLTIAWAALLLMFFQILMFGLYVANGVVEEKSSRVVEVLLATIRPLHLLWGKVIGIGAVGLVQLIVIGGCALAAVTATGIIDVSGTAVVVFASVVGWFILGYLFFAVLYAAAGSLVSRQEDVNVASMPITLLFMAMYIVSVLTVSDPTNKVGAVMAWIPPFSSMLMPLRVASGEANAVQIVLTVVLMLVVTAILAYVAARIYRHSILHSGDRLGWRQALRRG